MVLLNKLKHTGRYIKEKKTILRVNKHQGPRVTVGGQGSTQPVRHMYTSVNLQNPTPSLGLALQQSRDGSKLPLQGDQMLTLILGYHVLFGNSTGRVSDY